MITNDAWIYVISIILTAGLIGCVGYLLGSSIHMAKEREKSAQALEDENWQEPEPEIIGARVIAKRIIDGVTGSYRMPEYKMEMFVTFLTDDGETVEYEVEREVYERVYVDQTGNLVSINGSFFDFGDGEEIT